MSNARWAKMASMGSTERAVAGLAVIPPVSVGDFAEPEWIGPLAQEAERLGVESLVLPEHVVLAVAYTSRYPYSKSGRVPLPSDCVIPDPIDTLAYVAGVTTTLGLATGLLVLPWHHPLALAKRAATVDRLSGGRLRLGVGLGWIARRDRGRRCGLRQPGQRADETIDAMRAVWSADRDMGAQFEGRHFSFSGVQSFPRPVRHGGVPIEVGGTSPPAIRRAAVGGTAGCRSDCGVTGSPRGCAR